MSRMQNKNILIFRAYGISGNHFAVELSIAGQIQQLGAKVKWLVCDGVFEQCDHHWQLVDRSDKKAACEKCHGAALQRRDVYSLDLSGISQYLTSEDYLEVSDWCNGVDDYSLDKALYEGYPIGEWCKSSVNTQLRCAVIEFSNLLHLSVYRQYLRSTALTVIAYKRYLQVNHVDSVFMMNGRTFATRAVLEISKLEGIPVAIHEFGRSEETRILRSNENCHSLLDFSRSWESWRHHPLDIKERAEVERHFSDRLGNRVDFSFNRGNNVSAEKYLAGFASDSRLFALFTSSTDEIASAEGWGWKFSQLEWIEKVVEFFRSRSDCSLIIRCHPNHINALMGEDSQFLDGLKGIELPQNVIIVWPRESCNSYSLIEGVEGVLVYSSTVALESVLLGKKVYLAGGGLYRGRGIFWESDCSLAEVVREVESFVSSSESGCDREVAERFYYYLFFRQVYDVPFIKRVEGGRLVCKAEAFSALAESKIVSDLVEFFCTGKGFSPERSEVEGSSIQKAGVGNPQEGELFTVILTTYNRPGLLAHALNSLESQSFRDFEVVLVNDCGDPVESLLSGFGFPITYIRQGRNQGLSAARNAGLKLARGRYVSYLDDDDIYLPEHLAVLAETFEREPHAVVYTGVDYVNERVEGDKRIELNRRTPFAHEAYDKERLFVQNYIPVNTWAHPRSMLAEVGEFDTGLTAFEDWDMLLRLAARHPLVHVPQVTAEVHLRDAPNTGSDHMLGREQKNFGGLYQEMYRRHSDLGSDAVRQARQEMLKRFGIQDSAGGRVRNASLQEWLHKRVLTPTQQRLVEERLQQGGPSIGVVVRDMKGDAAAVALTLESLNPSRNAYHNVQPLLLTVAQSAAEGFPGRVVEVSADAWAMPLNQALQAADFDWLVLVNAGDELTSNGLLMACLELLTAPDCRAVYCDQMYRQSNGDLGAAFRPAFNLDYLLSFPAGMAHHWLFRRDVLLEAGGFDAGLPRAVELEMLLRLIGSGGLAGLGHIAEPLLITDAPTVCDIEDERQAILRHLQERGYEQPRIESDQPGQYRIHYGHPQQPMVSLLVLAGSQLARLQRCVESLLETTRYSRYELLLIESDPAAGEVRDWLKALEGMGEARLRTVWPAAAQLSAAAALNLAASQAKGDYLLLLSPDTAVIDPQWLDELVNHAQRPEVGVVGAKLLAADGSVRHAGLILGLEGPVGRPFVGEPLDAPGYLQRLQVDQNYSAVSRECLMIGRELFGSLGGIAEDLPENYIDADICLRARQAGYLTVWAANAKLMLDADEAPAVSVEGQDAFYAKWLPVLARDPAYNPSFSLAMPGGFKLADTALSWRPLSSWKPLPTVLAHPADQFGCGHYRVMQPFAALQQAGMADGALSMGLMHVTDLERYAPDTIVLQRQIGDERLEAMRRMKAFSGAFKVYELDDYLLNLPMKSAHRQHMPKDILKSLRRGLGFVDRFVVSTHPLAEAFAGMHEDIVVVENRLPVGWWQGLQGQRRVSAKPRVGWAGGSSHTGDLELIEDVVKELANEVEWVFFGMCPESMRPYVHEFHPGVAIEQYPAALARLNLDLALAPVEENLFNECKSNLRLLEYGACGFPVICSDIRCYQGDLPVTRVKNRFKDWVEAIRMHLADLEATARMGDELQAVVRRDWMLEGRNLELWLKGWTPGSH